MRSNAALSPASIGRGGNVTGVSWFSAELGAKRLGLLHELVPNAPTVALLTNPNNPESAAAKVKTGVG